MHPHRPSLNFSPAPASSSESASPSDKALALVLREAKKLHRSATTGTLSQSLPVLRRLMASHCVHGLSLPVLFQQRNTVQRKHVLRMLALEAGYASWEQYRPALAHLAPEALTHFDIARQQAGHLNLWFSSAEDACAHAQQHGGRALRFDRQGVVLTEQ